MRRRAAGRMHEATDALQRRQGDPVHLRCETNRTGSGVKIAFLARRPSGAKKLARVPGATNPAGMQMRRWISSWLAMGAMLSSLGAQTPDLVLPRPGAVIVTDVTGETAVVASGQRRVPKLEERLRVGSTLSTGRKSLFTVTLSNGATLQLGSESELEIEEFGQAPVSGTVKHAELKEEPTLSRTRLSLLRGDVILTVKPLKVARGSSFHLTLAAGTLRIAEGTVRARVQTSELGLGVATLELVQGKAEFEVPGGTFTPVPSGTKLAFALEVDKATGVTKVGPMPSAAAKAKQ